MLHIMLLVYNIMYYAISIPLDVLLALYLEIEKL